MFGKRWCDDNGAILLWKNNGPVACGNLIFGKSGILFMWFSFVYVYRIQKSVYIHFIIIYQACRR